MAGKLNRFQRQTFNHWKGGLTSQALVKSGKIGESHLCTEVL